MVVSPRARARLLAAAAGVSVVLFYGNAPARADDAPSGTTATTVSTESTASTDSAPNPSGSAESGDPDPYSTAAGGSGPSDSSGPGATSGDDSPGPEGPDSGGDDSGTDSSGDGGDGDSGQGDGRHDSDGSDGSGSAEDESGSTGTEGDSADTHPADTAPGTPDVAGPEDDAEATGGPATASPEPGGDPGVTQTGPAPGTTSPAPWQNPSSSGETTTAAGYPDADGLPDTAPHSSGTAPESDTDTDTDTKSSTVAAADDVPSAPLLTSVPPVPTAAQNFSSPAAPPADPGTPTLRTGPISSALGLLTFFGLPLLGGPTSPVPGNPIAWTLLWIVRRHQEHWHNQAPVAAPTVTTSDPETGVVTGDLNATDQEGDPITYQVTTGPTAGNVVIDPDGTFTYTPGEALLESGGTDTFTVTVSDATGAHHHHFAIPFWLGSTGHTTSTTVTVTVDAVATNEAPTLTIDAPSTVDPITSVATGTITATDPDDDPLTYAVNGITSTTNTFTTDKGTFTVNGDGTYTFTPTAAARWNASFASETAARSETLTVSVDDGQGGTDTQTVTIGITGIAAPGTPVGQPATSTDGRTYFTSFDSGTGTTYVTYVDPTTRAATTTAVTGTPLGGIQLAPNGTGYQTTTNGSDTTYITSFGGPAGDGMEYFFRTFQTSNTPVGTLRFDGDGNAYQVLSYGNNTAVYVIGADGAGKNHTINNEKPVGPVTIGPDGRVYLTTQRVASGNNLTRISILDPATGVTKAVNVAGVPAGTVYVGPDGSVYQVSYLANTDTATLYRYTATLTAPDDFDFDGRPYGGLAVDADGRAYQLTLLPDGNTQINVINFDWGYVGYTDVEGSPMGEFVLVPGTDRGYFITTTAGAAPGTFVTNVHAVAFDAFPPLATTAIEGKPVGGPVLSTDGKIYQVITSGDTTTVAQLGGTAQYQVSGTATAPVVTDGAVLYVTTMSGGTVYVHRIDTATGIHTVSETTGAADSGVHIATDGTVLHTVHSDGITRLIVISGTRL